MGDFISYHHGWKKLSYNFYRNPAFYLGLCHLPLLLPDPAAMEDNPEDEEDESQDRDPPGHGGHHQGRPHGQQDQGRVEGSAGRRSDLHSLSIASPTHHQQQFQS